MKLLVRILLVVVALCVPFVLLMGSIRILINPFFLHYEYSLPNFPEDDFGFTAQDRLKWGILSLEYLTNNENDEYLSTLKFEDGAPLYNERELEHMLDVRILVRSALIAWYIVAAFLVVAAVILWKSGRISDFWMAISSGGWLTLGLILVIIAGVFLDFYALFAGFHAIFFEGDTWLFFADDTLIRLYPEKLWSDAFIFMGVFTLAGAVITIIAGRRFAQKERKNR